MRVFLILTAFWYLKKDNKKYIMWYLHLPVVTWLTALSLQTHSASLSEQASSQRGEFTLPLISSPEPFGYISYFWTWSTRLKRQWMKTILLKRWSKKTVLWWLYYFVFMTEIHHKIHRCWMEMIWPNFLTLRQRNLNKAIEHVFDVLKLRSLDIQNRILSSVLIPRARWSLMFRELHKIRRITMG